MLFPFFSGIGLEAAKLLAIINPSNRIFVVARTLEKAKVAKDSVVECIPKDKRKEHSDNVIPLECDHCSLESVRRFNRNLRRELDDSYSPSKWEHNGIDALCLNAAILLADEPVPSFTEDGLEVTFQTNHLSPFLIANLTVDLINPSGRVVFSTSGLHLRQELNFDGMIDLHEKKARKGFEMMNGADFHFKKAYAASKLCNVATCVELNRRLQKRGATATCFSPGLITTSGLFRRQPLKGDTIAMIHSQEVLRKEKTVRWGGGALVFMAIADEVGKMGGQYWRDADSYAGNHAQYGKEFGPSAISDKQVRKDKRDLLWLLSCQLAGIPARLQD